jgi:hypothetical protein
MWLLTFLRSPLGKWVGIGVVVFLIVGGMYSQILYHKGKNLKLQETINKQALHAADLETLIIKLRTSTATLESMVAQLRQDKDLLKANNAELQRIISDNEALCAETIANLKKIVEIDSSATNITPEPGQVIDFTSSDEYIDLINESYSK